MRHDEIMLRHKLAAANGRASALVFGATMTAGPYAALEPLIGYLRENSDRDVRFIIADTRRLLSLLDAGQIQFALVEGIFPRSEYDSLPYTSEPFCGVAAPDYRFHTGAVHRIEDLLQERLLIREEGSGTREIFASWLTGRNLTLYDFARRVEVNSIQVIKQLAASGCGITFVYRRAVAEELKKGQLMTLPLRDFRVEHDFSIVWSRGSIYADEWKTLFRDA
ncbi:MAG: LysR substrate-binding domain-containing protein [Anaerovoracaceae bacterium]|jgi:DNA-binding transcriptional LysR family regulator